MSKAPFSYPDSRDPIWRSAWRDALMWAIGEPDILSAFEKDTGQSLWTPPANALDAMIDGATGFGETREQAYISFINWFNENVWGADEMVSPLFREPPVTDNTGAE